MVFDMFLFVLLCVMAVVEFTTRRGNRLMGVLSLTGAVMTLSKALDQPPIDHLLPAAWQLGLSDGLVVLAFLTLFLGTLATTFHRRQPH